MNCGLKPSIFILLSILLQGCSPSPALSQEARHVKADIESLRGSMTVAGNSTWKKGEGIARRINSLPEDEKTAMSASYMKELEVLGDSDVNPEHRTVWLYNYQSLLKTIDLCMDNLIDKEIPLRLYAHCIDRYAESIHQCRTQAGKDGNPNNKTRCDELRRNLETDGRLVCANVRKVLLPLVVRKQLTSERYEYWCALLEGKMKNVECGTNNVVRLSGGIQQKRDL